jgi:hypothetical protein
VKYGLELLLALPCATLPKRYWQSIDLPVDNVAAVSAMLTLFLGAALGISGFFAHMEAILAAREFTPSPWMMPAFFGYVFFTPRGLFSLYLVVAGLLRAVGSFTGEPFGDPILTGIDAVVSRTRTSQREQSARAARERLERSDEPDRRYDGEWAGLAAVDYVIVAARRKPGWTKGTWVITAEGWFTLGEPFDRPTPNGLRTVYPLTLQTTTLDVLRKGVSYELPPLRRTSARPETSRPSGES